MAKTGDEMRFSLLSDQEFQELQEEIVKPNTKKVFENFKKLFLKFLKENSELELSVLPKPDVEELSLRFLSTVRTLKGEMFKQSSFKVMKWVQ